MTFLPILRGTIFRRTSGGAETAKQSYLGTLSRATEARVVGGCLEANSVFPPAGVAVSVPQEAPLDRFWQCGTYRRAEQSGARRV
ncbi:hypothetical protein NDU88_000470 [Pleurodeles waltl]|uniref:Uncharacterized protein n=1 Tax=Pleurodeles waltl TaxID=8319 RepID=A0AAV7VY86_PLEWA|nr:hypothetical protein NDU88_000470 [Pleurodeles waltl]